MVIITRCPLNCFEDLICMSFCLILRQCGGIDGRTSSRKRQEENMLIYWGRVTQIYVRKLTTIGSDNGLLPDRRQAITWTNAGMLLIWPLGTNFSEISIEIHISSFKKMQLKMSSGKWRLSCLGLNVLILQQCHYCWWHSDVMGHGLADIPCSWCSRPHTS